MEPGAIPSRLPLVGAPMAGGAMTVALAKAVGEAGGLPFLAGGYKTPDEMSGEIDGLRETCHAFGVNLFVPGTSTIEGSAFESYAAELKPEAERYGIDLETRPKHDDDGWSEKLQVLTSQAVPFVSFTFGLPDESVISALQSNGTTVFGTVTSEAEAALAEEAGVNGLVVQGFAAGGHSGTFDPHRVPENLSTADLTRAIRNRTRLPVIAAGGVDGPEHVRELLDAGAQGVAVGTLLLRTAESGAAQVHKDALADPRFGETVITHAFTGRPARGLRNGFIDRHEAEAPIGYPELIQLTRPIRQEGMRSLDPDSVHLWAGTGFRNATTRSAGEVITELAEGAGLR